MAPALTFSLMHDSARMKGKRAIKSQFLKAYMELESRMPLDFSLGNVVACAFMRLGKQGNVPLFRECAMQIASVVDESRDFSDRTKNLIYHNPVHFAKVKAVAWLDPLYNEKEAMIESALAFIYATDVSGSPSPASIVRAQHDHFFKGQPGPENPFGCLAPILQNETDTLIASLLQDADVLHSTLNQAQHVKENARVLRELKVEPTMAAGLSFFGKILDGRLATDVVRSLSDTFIKRQMARYKKAISLGVA